MIGETLSHYQIIGKVGAGGMGVVYRAHDPRLDRDVAVKVMPDAVGQDPMRIERFQREAKAAGALNHPNILAIYDVGTHDGEPYIVTELLEGSTLADRMDEGTMTRRTGLQIAAQIAQGLAAAHSRGIVHRDLKPANVFISRNGNVKILDFGLAKLLQDQTGDEDSAASAPTVSMGEDVLLTAPGIVVGTPGYMAPEVLNGDAADQKSDIFSLGVIVYELLAGQHPFRGPSRASLQAAILRDDPAPLHEAMPPVSPALERVVFRCLEKRPQDRFESAQDLAFAMETISADSVTRPVVRQLHSDRKRIWMVAVTAVVLITALSLWVISTRRAPPILPEDKRIVVLPLESKDADPTLHLMAGGLSTAIFDTLNIIEDDAPGLLWSITAEPNDEGSFPTLDEIRREHNVNLAIAGELEDDGDRITLTLMVIDTTSGNQLRSETIETSIGNLTTLQRSLSTRVTEMLGFPVDRELEIRLVVENTNLTPAYLPYLNGRGALARSTGKEQTRLAIELLNESVAADPAYSPARAALAEAWLRDFEADQNPASLDEALRHARASADPASTPPESSMVLARILTAAGHDDEALRALESAVRIAPNRATAHIQLAKAFQRLERYDEADAAFERAINLRPSWWRGYFQMAWLYLAQGEYDAAANRYRRVTELAPDNAAGANNLGSLYYFLERRDDAERLFLQSIRIEPNADAYSNLGTLVFEDARFGDAAGYFEKALELQGGDFGLWSNLASAYHWGGDAAQAETAFRQAVELGEELLEDRPGDAELMAILSGCYGMLDENARGLELVDQAIATDPENDEILASIGESLEDLNERDRALDWIGRALEAGLNPAWIDRRPGLRSLSSDPRYTELINEREEQTGATGSQS